MACPAMTLTAHEIVRTYWSLVNTGCIVVTPLEGNLTKNVKLNVGKYDCDSEFMLEDGFKYKTICLS